MQLPKPVIYQTNGVINIFPCNKNPKQKERGMDHGTLVEEGEGVALK